MLGLLKDKDKLAEVVISKKIVSPNSEITNNEHDYSEALKQCADDLIKAIESKNTQEVIYAMKSMYYCFDNECEEDELEEKKKDKIDITDLLGD